jgi:hopanoid C-3 methylase
MKINLYYPPLTSQRFDGINIPINTERNYNPKSALLVLASSFKMLASNSGMNYEIEVIDMQLDNSLALYKSFPYGENILNCYRSGSRFTDYKDKIKEAKVHGISSNFTINAQVAIDLVKYIKSITADSIVIVGGIDATTRPEYYINHGADIVVLGEGEIIFYEIIKALYKGKNYENIPNTYTIHKKDPIIDKSLYLELDDLPLYDLDLISDLKVYNDTGEGPPPEGVQLPYICFETSRGCFHSCSFCTTPIVKGRYRTMSPGSVEKHLKHFKQKGIKTILIQEDNILSRLKPIDGSNKRNEKGRNDVIEIFSMLKEYGFAWEYANGLEIGKLLINDKPDDELIEALFWNKRELDGYKGCYRVQIPIESFDEQASLKFSKLIDFPRQVETYKKILTAGVNYQTYNFLIGYPDDTMTSFENYQRKCDYLSNELHKISSKYNPYFNVFNLILLPGTRDFSKYESMLQFDIDEHPEVFGFNLPAINTKHFKYHELFEQRIKISNCLNKDMVSIYDRTYSCI